MKRDQPADSRLVRIQQGFIGAWILWIAWRLPDANAWQFTSGVALIVAGIIAIIVLEVQFRRRRAVAR